VVEGGELQIMRANKKTKNEKRGREGRKKETRSIPPPPAPAKEVAEGFTVKGN
jgi:hypothetical protein